jgi:hypothetical protein
MMFQYYDVAMPAPYWYDEGKVVTRFDGTVVATATPEPATMALVASGFAGMAGFARRRRRGARPTEAT